MKGKYYCVTCWNYSHVSDERAVGCIYLLCLLWIQPIALNTQSLWLALFVDDILHHMNVPRRNVSSRIWDSRLINFLTTKDICNLRKERKTSFSETILLFFLMYRPWDRHSVCWFHSTTNEFCWRFLMLC